MDTTGFWFWFGFVGMLVGSAGIVFQGLKLRKQDRYHALIPLLVTAIATISYYALARGTATITVGGDIIYIGRYLDWLFTTPLLLLSIIVVGLPAVTDLKQRRERSTLIASVLIADILMIVTGAFADLATNTTDTIVWYGASCLWLLLVLYLMYGEIKRQAIAHGKAAASVYTRLLAYLTVAWVLYPVVWIYGTPGFEIINKSTEAATFAILDVCAKAVFGVLVVTYVLKLENKAK